jgi:hypothetical protein
MVRSDEKGPLSITRHYNTPSKKVLDLFFGPRTDKSRNKILAFFAPRTRIGFGFPASDSKLEYLILIIEFGRRLER